MLKPRDTQVLYVALLLVLTGLGATGALTLVTQLQLKDHELVVRTAYGSWNALLSDAKTLGLQAPPLPETRERFRTSLFDFIQDLDRLRDGPSWSDAQLRQREQALYQSLAFALPFVQDLDRWLGTGGPDPTHLSWIRTRLADLDRLFGPNLASLKTQLKQTIEYQMREAGVRSAWMASVLLVVLTLVLGLLLFQLRVLHLRLRSINAHLNELVEVRTARLEEAQAQLVASEKLAVLGQLAAGVAHELNSPLAALQSASQTLAQFLTDGMADRMQRIDTLSPEAREDFLRVLDFASTVPDTLRPSRAAAKAREWAQELRALGAEDPERQAEAWLDLGLADRPDVWKPLCLHPQILVVLSLSRSIADARRMTAVMLHAVTRSVRVVQSLRSYLDGSHIEDPQWFSLRADVEASLALVPQSLARGVAFECEVPPDLLLWGTRERLGQVWTNLLTNALQALGGHGALAIRARAVEGRVEVSVVDSGPGISPESLGRIFQAFYTTKTATGGLGLGLDICRRIVESNGGTLTCTSEPGRTEFVVSLPQVTAAERPGA